MKCGYMMRCGAAIWLVLCCTSLGAAERELVPQPAAPADEVVRRLGVATHWDFNWSVYFKKWEQVSQALGELGVRIVRDAIDPRLEDLWRRYGVRAILVTEPKLPLDEQRRWWREHRHLIEAIEGPNEVNASWKRLGLSYRGRAWPDGAKEFQDDLYALVKGDSLLKDVPVIAPSMWNKAAGPEIAPLRSFDIANAHSYAGGAPPARGFDFRDPFLLLGPGAAIVPLAATESGYHTCLGDARVIAGTQLGVSHAAQRKYIPRHVLEYFNAGHRWTILYELAAGRAKGEQEDPEAAFGLLLPDASPKPAYFALRDLVAALGEARWDAAAGRWIEPPPRPARSLAFALRNAPATVHHTLLHRADGSFQLLIWNEVSSFDLKDKRDIVNADIPVTLELPAPADITVSRLGPGAAPAVRHTAVRTLPLMVPDEVLIVRIQLAATQAPAPLPAPVGIESSAGPTSVELVWPVATGVDAYWVSSHGRQLGRATVAQGKARFKTTRLIPAMTYPFEIVAAGGDGAVSPPARITVTTVNRFPDLVVSELVVTPAAPAPGEAVSFLATVENRGAAATEEGVIIGVKFSVDGKTLCWNDRLIGPLKPGERIQVRPSGSAGGVLTWTAAAGRHVLGAMADDMNRLAESDETNNRRSVTVEVAGPR